MRFLPYQKFQLTSNLKPNELEEKMARYVGIGPKPLAKGTDNLYDGWIMNRQFRMRHSIMGRNSFLPLVTGTIEPYEQGSIMRVKMMIEPAVAVITGIAVFFMIAMFITNIVNSVQNSWFNDIMPYAGIAVFMYCLMIFSYNAESRRTTNFLIDIVNNEV